MTAPFTLTKQTDVRMVLSNWRQRDIKSRWLLRSVAIDRLH